MGKVLTVGETMAVFTSGRPGYLRYADRFHMGLAGAESNVAQGVVKLGHEAEWVSRLGEDEFGAYVHHQIRGEGVNTDHVIFDSSHGTGIMFKQTKSRRETKVFYYRENSAASHMTEKDIPPSLLKGTQILHMTGITPVLGDGCTRLTKELVAQARGEGVCFSFDPNIRKKLWGKHDFSGYLRDLMLEAQIVLLGREEGELLLGTGDAVRIIDWLLEKGKAQYVAVKMGDQGAVCGDRKEILPIPPHPCHCVDPIGAGDAFNAGFLCGVMEKQSLEICGRMGAIAGALATEALDDTSGYPTKEEMNHLLNKIGEVYR